jgi:acyl-CoA synthetase (NDP forming)
VRAAIIMTSGFGETSDPQSIDAERAIVARAAPRMRVIGPNSQGLANFGSGAVASFSTMFSEIEPADGPVAIVSQSGMMSAMPYGLLRGQGIGVRHVHATGNDADVTLPEVALAYCRTEVRLLLLYIESIRDADTLAQAAALARERDVPIVALKTGRTARGQSAARSHTGALANEDRVVDAFFRQHGIWRVRDVEQLVGATELYLTGWRPLGRRLVVVSNSGAACVMAADAMREVGLELANLAGDTFAQSPRNCRPSRRRPIRSTSRPRSDQQPVVRFDSSGHRRRSRRGSAVRRAAGGRRELRRARLRSRRRRLRARGPADRGRDTAGQRRRALP